MMKIFLYLLSSVLYILSFPTVDFSWLAWISLIPMIFAVDIEKDIRRVVRNSFFCGWSVFLASMYWLTYITVLGWILLTFCLAWYFVVFAVIRFYDKKFIAVPIAWTALEFIRGHFLGGMPWLLLGASQYSFLPLIQISNITSVYGVTFVVALINAGIADACKKRFTGLFIAFVVVLLVIGYGKYNLSKKVSEEKIKIGIVQPNISQEVKWDPEYTEWMFEKLADLTKNIDSADIIVWPETAVPTIMEIPSLFDRIKILAKDKNSILIIGSQGVHAKNKEDILYFNSAFFISREGDFLGEYSKIHLVPFGEYVPFAKYLPFLKWFTPIEEGFTQGTEYKVFTISGLGYRVSALICFEDIFPGLARRFVKNGANILVNITNDAWYDKTNAVYQHAYLSVFRAIENGVPLIRATNTGLSCFIDYTGLMHKVIPFVPVSESQEIIVPKITTFYTKYGDVFGWICLILFLMSLTFRRSRELVKH